ncbi:MAG: phosphoribosylformylglycinamidine synthase, partial [Gammaproteobacteria bacterium]
MTPARLKDARTVNSRAPSVRRSPEPSLVLDGVRALSGFRFERLTQRVSIALPGAVLRDASHVYFVELKRPLDDVDRERLSELLQARDAATSASGAQLLITPRPSTTSPWSSKATDIVHGCGLDAIRRVERGVRYLLEFEAPYAHGASATPDAGTCARTLGPLLHDRMTQVIAFEERAAAADLFAHAEPRALQRITLTGGGMTALAAANASLGLALNEAEMHYLLESFRSLGRDPSDVELMMFAQANSEHCRHKIFNSPFVIDGRVAPHTLFQMIRHTHERNPGGVLSAYSDNAAVTAGARCERLEADQDIQTQLVQRADPQAAGARAYRYVVRQLDLLMKVETHNHPTAISPYPGAATGAGGEIRDEAATGRGSRGKAGLTGFSVSHLRIPDFEQPWEPLTDIGRPPHLASPLEIMLDGPIGAASFNNEFGRPALGGYFRTFEARVSHRVAGEENVEIRGYHKPIMIAGGMGNIDRAQVSKLGIPPGSLVVVLGGPAMLIGLGGGAASSVTAGASAADLDFASVQRDNAEMQRRCQEVIDRCWQQDEGNPILSLHDVGAGGLSNAVPELLNDAGRGGRIDLGAIPCDDPSLSPAELWCNESQERFVLAVAPADRERFDAICARERCPYAVIGVATQEARLVVEGGGGNPPAGLPPVDLPLSLLLGDPPLAARDVTRTRLAQYGNTARSVRKQPRWLEDLDLAEAAHRVLTLPAV